MSAAEEYDDRPRATVVRLADVEAERVSWLWPGRIPLGKITVLDGDPGVGKSTVSLDMAARVSTGRAWPDASPCPRGSVVLLSAEDGLADTIRPRLDAAGADTSRVRAITAVPVVTTGDDGLETIRHRPPHLGDLGQVEDVIRTSDALLLVVDVLMAYLPSGVDSHRDQDVRGVLHQLAAMAERTGCAVLLLRHMNKNPGGSPLYRGGGSIGIVGAARAGFVAAKDPDDDTLVVLAPTKNNLAPMPPALGYRLEQHDNGAGRIAWAGVVDRQAGDLLRHRDDDDGDERREIDRWLIDYLTDAGGTAPASEVTAAGKQAGFTEAAIKKARIRIKATTERHGFGPGGTWTWSIGTPIEPIDTSTREPEPMEPMPEPMSLCPVCRTGLDPVLLDAGYGRHPGCEDDPEADR